MHYYKYKNATINKVLNYYYVSKNFTSSVSVRQFLLLMIARNFLPPYIHRSVGSQLRLFSTPSWWIPEECANAFAPTIDLLA